MNIRFARDGKEIGEYPEEAVWALLQSGVLKGGDLFWREGMDSWSPIDSKWSLPPVTLPPPVANPSQSMKTCPSCRHQVGDNARNCPKCGHTFTTAGGIFIAIIVALVIGGCVFRMR